MRHWHVVAVGLLVLSTGCMGLGGGGETASAVDITVQNDCGEPVPFRLTVAGESGTQYANESDRLSGGVARAFEGTVGTTGRHEATVTGEDWQGQPAWNAESCERFDATVRITEGSVEVAGECLEQR